MGHESGFGLCASRRAAAVQKKSSRNFGSFGYKCITFRNPQRCLPDRYALAVGMEGDRLRCPTSAPVRQI
jgi:hypothetical protein